MRKLCVACKNYKAPVEILQSDLHKYSECMRYSTESHVTGVDYVKRSYCWIERDAEGASHIDGTPKCGPSGRYYEPIKLYDAKPLLP